MACRFCDKQFSRNFNCKRHEKICNLSLDTEKAGAKAQVGYGDLDHGDSKNSSLSEPFDIDSEYDYDAESENSTEEDSGEESDKTNAEVDYRAPWDNVISGAYKDHAEEYNELTDEFMEEGCSKRNAEAKAHNALLRKYRQSLRERLVE